MAKWCFTVALLVVILPTVFGGAGGDAEKIQGSWQFVEAFFDGKRLPAEEREGVRMEFRNGILTTHVKGKAPIKGSYSLKSDQKPCHIDLVLPGKGKGKDVIRAIYELNGDTLKICHAFSSDDKRPTEFASTKQAALMTLKREKK